MNHFYISYAGNKRREMCEIYPKLNLDNVKIVVEPFAGSCAMSYDIWTKNKDKNYQYILNDLDPFLFQLYKISKEHDKQIEIEKIISNLTDKFNTFQTMDDRKEWYDSLKKDSTFENELFMFRHYSMIPRLCPSFTRTKTIPEKKKFKFSNFKIFEFFNNANIEFSNKDGAEIYDKFRSNQEALILLDPPYILSDVSRYQNSSGIKIFEYLAENKIEDEPAKIYIIVEFTWIMKLLFKNSLIHQYSKKYEQKHYKTIHGIFSNIH